MTEPSKVIHVRNVGHEISENDLLQLFQPFGVITKLVMLRAKNQALLQMQDIAAAVNAIQFYSNVQPSIRGRNVYVQFSSHQELTTVEQSSQGRGDEPNRILLVSIHHVLYPVTVDVLHQVFSPHGIVEKIVTFQKSAGFQALIQYQLLQTAISARNSLQGRNIYDGCCQLDIQFSNLDELQVNYNNERSRDFTNPNLPAEQKGKSPQQGYGDAGAMYSMQGSGPRGVGFPQVGNAAAIAAAFPSGLPPGISGTNDRCTVLVSNVDPDRIDEDKLFNLFSLYGNIVRIKLLRNKPDHALVQMGDGFQAELAVHFLKGAMLFGQPLEVNYSKHPNIITGPETRDYSNSNLNRFNRNAAKNYRYCCSPTKMIHLSTLPQDVTEEEILAHLEEHGPIVNTKLFEMNGKKQALVLFENEEQATEALVCKHATSLDGSIIRISFSQISAVARIRNALAYATHTFFHNNGFLYIHTPIITTSDCEGAGEMFQVTSLISEAEKLEKELKENPAPSESDIKAAEELVKERGEAVAQLKASKGSIEKTDANIVDINKKISAAVAELQRAKENLLKLQERYRMGERYRLSAGIPKKDGKVDYAEDFFGRQAFLTVSGQLQVETYACALSSVYTFGPTFRAEQSHTTRHLAEFWMVEPEIAFADIQDDMNCAEAYVKFLCQWLLDHCLDDMEFMTKFIDKDALSRLRMVASSNCHRITYTEAIDILEVAAKVKKFENKVEWGIDLASEHERYLTEEHFKAPVIVFNYPKGIKAFYMKVNEDGKTVAAMDLLVPKVGELIGGSQREENYEVLRSRILDMGLPLEPYEWYLDLRRYGTVKHSGFGLGFERMILFATGIENIRDVIPFPRYPGRADL